MIGYTTISKNNIDDYIDHYVLIVFALRNSRIKAKQLAIMEAYFALSTVGGIFVSNGPLGDVKGVFSFFVPIQRLEEVRHILKGIGYCNRFYILDFRSEQSENHTDIISINELVWKGKRFSLHTFLIQDASIYEAQSPHNRKFIIMDHNNEEKVVHGYRGDGTETGRRALPVEDGRCLVNLSSPYNAKMMLDPFAGGGGIVFQAKYLNAALDVYSIDIDPIVAPGLQFYGSRHAVGDARDIQFEAQQFDSIVTEVPFASSATDTVIQAIEHLKVFLKDDGQIVMMSGVEQAMMLDQFVRSIGFYNYVFEQINRKGTDVAIMAWTKSSEKVDKLKDFLDVVKKIH